MLKFFIALIFIFNFSHSESLNFEKRKEILLRHFSKLEQQSFPVSIARFYVGDIESGVKIFDALISNPSGDMFFMFQSLMTYLYAKDKMPEWLKQKYRNVWKTYTPYRGDTENHLVMYYSSLYLASQEWKNVNGSEWYTGKSSYENFKESEGWLNEWINIAMTIGQGEFDSPHYMPFFLIPMFMLYEFAEDSLMKLKAQMIIDCLMADYAVEYLSGCYCGGHSREYEFTTINPRNDLLSSFAYLYFGAFEDTSENLSRYGLAIFPAITSYKLPEIIYQIANDRNVPYEHKERKRVRNVIRYGSEKNPAVYRYTYMTKDYCIGSLHGGILQPIQQHSWDITFSDLRGYNTVFSVHPYVSDFELGMFFPEEIKILEPLVVSSKPTYSSPDKWTSASPYEKIFQYKGTLIALYGLSEMKPSERFKHVNVFIPRGLDEFVVDTTGWFVGRMGNGYFGLRIINGLWEMKVDSISYKLRVYGERVCLIVEAGSRDEFGEFNKFVYALRTSSLNFNFANFKVKYKGLRGAEIEFDYNGNRFLNGVKYELNWGLFDGPYLKSKSGSKIIEIDYKGRKRILDFNEIRIIEKN